MGKGCYKGDPNDIIIIAVGPTGSGKTNFINTLTGEIEQRSASSLKPDTQSITPHPVSYDNRRLVLVDTPGFDDASRPHAEVVVKVADWLKQKYGDGSILTGIVYFHQITDNRVPVADPPHKNLQTFCRRCGNIHLRRARLVTTMWDKVKDRAAAENRETQLTGDFWQELIGEGAVARRFDNTRPCAWSIVRELVDLGRDGGELGQQTGQNVTEANAKPAGCFSGFCPATRS